MIADQIADQFPLEEYGKISLREEFSEFDVVIVSLSNSSKSKAFVLISIPKNDSFKRTKKRIKKLIGDVNLSLD